MRDADSQEIRRLLADRTRTQAVSKPRGEAGSGTIHRLPGHPSEFILTRFSIFIFSSYYSPKTLGRSNSVLSLEKLKGVCYLPLF